MAELGGIVVSGVYPADVGAHRQFLALGRCAHLELQRATADAEIALAAGLGRLCLAVASDRADDGALANMDRAALDHGDNGKHALKRQQR